MSKKTRSGENIFTGNPVAVLLSATLALLPAIMLPITSDVYALPKTAFLYIATFSIVFVYVTKALRSGELTIYRSRLDVPVLIILGFATISLLASDIPLLGLVGKYRRYEALPALFCYAALYFFAAQSIRTERDFERMLKIMALGFAPIAFYGLLQAGGIDFPGMVRLESRVTSSLGNPVLFGVYLIIMLPLLFALERTVEEDLWRLFSWILMLAGVINLTYTESRGAWIGLTAAAIAMFIKSRRTGLARCRRRGSRVKDRRLLIAALAIVAVMLVAPYYIAPDNQVGERLASTLNVTESSVATRVETWKASLAMIADRPVLGYGLEQMGYWFPLYKTNWHVVLEPQSLSDRAHNDFLQVAIDMGLPGLMAYLWMFVAALVIVFRGRKVPRETPYSIGLFGVIVGYLAQAQTGISAVFIAPIIWSLLAVSVGPLVSASSTKQWTYTLPERLNIDRVVTLGAIALAAVAIAALVPLAADVHIHRGKQLAQTAIEQAAPEFETALKLFPYQPEYARQTAAFYLHYARSTQDHVFARRAALAAEQGLRYNGRDFELAFYGGEANLFEYRLTENEMALAGAEKHFGRAARLWPNLVLIKKRLFETKTLMGKTGEAAALANELVRLGQKDPNLYYALAAYAQQQGDEETAKRYFKKLKDINPNLVLKSRAE